MYSDTANDNHRQGRRTPLGIGINNLLNNIGDGDDAAKKAYRAAQVQSMFKQAIKHIYGQSAFLILQSINAVYILNDRDKGDLKLARPTDKKIKRLVIYTCDSMVHADLDSRQEAIKFWFSKKNERLDKLELYSSKFNMRKRFPYKNDCEMMKNSLVNSNKSKNEKIDIELSGQLKTKIDNIKDEKLKAAIMVCVNLNTKKEN